MCLYCHANFVWEQLHISDFLCRFMSSFEYPPWMKLFMKQINDSNILYEIGGWTLFFTMYIYLHCFYLLHLISMTLSSAICHLLINLPPMFDYSIYLNTHDKYC
jgi:hypothetical protein